MRCFTPAGSIPRGGVAQQNLTTTTVSINEGFREVKGLLRDLDQKLDRKADKVGR